MGRRQKKTKVGNDREMRAVTRNFSRGTGPDLKTVGDKKLRRELIVKEKKNAMAVKSAALAQLMLPEVGVCLSICLLCLSTFSVCLCVCLSTIEL